MKAELIMIPFAIRGHLNTALEMAKLLVTRSHDLRITVLLIKLPGEPNLAVYADSLVTTFASERIHFLDISLNTEESDVGSETNRFIVADRFISSHRSRVRDEVFSRPRLAGLVLDMACMALSDELSVPTYAFWPASGASLGLHFHVQIQTQSMDLKADHSLHGFRQPVPGRVFPPILFDAAAHVFLNGAKRIRESRGIIVNSSSEIEPQALHGLISGSSSPVYAVGPILHVPENGENTTVALWPSEAVETSMDWLDNQPQASVLFLCFGSIGGNFHPDQLKEIAAALESVGCRYLWSLRQFSSDPEKILPEGFLERIAGRGRVIGWAPQAAVLGHVAVGGFVSHCGWNSVLESLWFGVPIATWPLHSEQQLNAFQMVAELGLAVEVKMDYRFDLTEDDDVAIASAEVIEAAIGKVMEGDSEIRKRVEEMSIKCRNAIIPGGSSFSSVDRFISDVFENINIK